jgi:tetratricopeptide (TPR) repeat protein
MLIGMPLLTTIGMSFNDSSLIVYPILSLIIYICVGPVIIFKVWFKKIKRSVEDERLRGVTTTLPYNRANEILSIPSSKEESKFASKANTRRDYEDLYNKGAIALNRKKNPQEALNYFKQASKLVNDDPELFCNMGVALLQLGALEKGKSFLLRSIKLDPHNSITLLNLATAVSMEGQYGEAIQILERLLSYDPDFQQAFPLLMQIKRQKELFGSLDVDGKNIPKKSLSLFRQGITTANQEKLPEAIRLIKAAIQEYPKFAEAYLYLGVIEQSRKNQQTAFEYFNKALEYDPNLSLAWVHKGVVYDSQGLYNKAIKCYDRAIELNPNYSASYNNKGLALDALENYEEAIKCYNKSIELNPDFEGAYNNRATSHKKSNKLERALADYRKVLELNPRDDYAKEQIDTLKHHNTMGIDNTLRSVVDGRDYCPRCGKKNYTNSGICPYCRTPMHKINVEELLQTAIDDEYEGKFENALMTLLRINEREPTFALAWFYRGKAHCALGEFNNAIMCFGKSQQLGFNLLSKLMQFGLRAQNNQKHFTRPNLSEEHLATIDVKISEMFPDDEITWNATGAALQMLMRYEEAYKSYQNVLKIKPDFTVAKKNMEVIEKL